MEEMNEPIQSARGGRLLKALSRRLSRRTTDSDSVESTSSNESMAGEQGRSDDRSSCSASDSGSDGSERNRRHRSTVSLRRVFQSLSLSSRSQSCSPTERSALRRSNSSRSESSALLSPIHMYEAYPACLLRGSLVMQSAAPPWVSTDKGMRLDSIPNTGGDQDWLSFTSRIKNARETSSHHISRFC